jgi:murein endopeptidase
VPERGATTPATVADEPLQGPAVTATAAAPSAASYGVLPVLDGQQHAGDGASSAVAGPAHEAIDDEIAASEAAPISATPQPQVEIGLTDLQIRTAVRKDLGSLGPMSVGRTNRGAVLNGVRMLDGEHWTIIDQSASWGTQETIDFLSAGIETVVERYPNTPKMRIGHLSAKQGGSLSPHKSHQSGRDVDVSYYYLASAGKFRWYSRATAKNLDRARTWTFVRALLTDADIEYMFINTSVQKLLRQHAESVGEDKEWLDRIFEYGSPRGNWPLIRHARGHDTHIHVRFYNPHAQEMGRRAFKSLVDANLIKPHIYYTRYRVRKGEILGRIAKRFGTTVKAIRRANKLPNSKIRAGKTYLIPRKGQVKAPGRTLIPPRRLPPSAGTQGVAAPKDQSP